MQRKIIRDLQQYNENAGNEGHRPRGKALVVKSPFVQVQSRI